MDTIVVATDEWQYIAQVALEVGLGISGWSRDGRYLLYQALTAQIRYDIRYLRLEIPRSEIDVGVALLSEFAPEFRFGTCLCCPSETSEVSP